MAVQSLPTTWAVPLGVHVVNTDGTTGDLLTDRTDVQVQIGRHKEWSVTFSVPCLSDQAAAVTTLRKLRITFGVGDTTVTLFDAVIRRRRRVIISPNDEAGEVWSVTAYDVGSDYAKRRVKAYPAGQFYNPAGGTAANARKGWEPFSQTRTFGWPDPTYVFEDHGATSAVQLWQQSNPLPFPYGRSGAPFGWLDNTAWWIWDRAISGLAHPQGTIYGSKQFTLSGTRKLIIDSAGDDAYELYLNGVLLCARKMEEDGSTWTRLARTEVTVGPGTHTLRFSCTNEGGGTGNIGGFICSVFNQANGSLICHTDSSWKVIGYPAEIGQTPGQILTVLLQDDPVTRGFPYPSLVPGLTFGPVNDTAGRPQPIIPKFPVTCGRTVQEVIDQLAATYIEYEWLSGVYGVGHALSIWSAEGVQVAGGGTAPATTTSYPEGRLRAGEGGNVQEVTADESTENLFTTLMYLWGKGYSELPPDLSGIAAAAAAETAWGRHEGFLPIGDVDDPDTAFWTAFQNVSSGCQPRYTVTTKLSDGAGRARRDVPFIHYGMHHTVPCPNIDDGPDDDLRLVGMTLTENKDTGLVEIVPTYATRVDVWEERIQRWLERQTYNPQNGLTDAASPESPSIISTTVIQAQHETFSGDVATVGAVGTPWQPTETVVVTQALARSEDAGTGTTTVVTTIDGFVTSPARLVSMLTGQKQGFAQFNGTYLLVVTPAQALNVAVTADGGHKHISVDLFYAPYPFGGSGSS